MGRTREPAGFPADGVYRSVLTAGALLFIGYIALAGAAETAVGLLGTLATALLLSRSLPE